VRLEKNGRLRLSASDVANFLACGHLTRLDLLHARGELHPPYQADTGFEDLVRRGEEHEKTVLDGFRAAGYSITQIPGEKDADAATATAAAIRDGADVIYQAVLRQDPAPEDEDEQGPALYGRPDFLIRAGLLKAPDSEPRPLQTHYEVVDAKLARTAKARAVAQVAFYTHLLANQQGTPPRWMHLALGNREFTSLKTGDYAAYERQTRRVLAAFLATDRGENPPNVPYPEPVEHCAICRWAETCTKRRRRDDDLSLIAGMPAGQRRALKTPTAPSPNRPSRHTTRHIPMPILNGICGVVGESRKWLPRKPRRRP
jgi:predicted RecB family nuclease